MARSPLKREAACNTPHNEYADNSKETIEPLENSFFFMSEPLRQDHQYQLQRPEP